MTSSNEDTVTVTLPREVVKFYGYPLGRWTVGSEAEKVGVACRAALDRPSLPEGVEALAWCESEQAWVMRRTDVPEGWHFGCHVGHWMTAGISGMGYVVLARPAPQPKVERVLALDAIRRAATGVPDAAEAGETWPRFTARAVVRDDNGTLWLTSSDEDTSAYRKRIAPDGTVEVLVEGSTR